MAWVPSLRSSTLVMDLDHRCWSRTIQPVDAEFKREHGGDLASRCQRGAREHGLPDIGWRKAAPQRKPVWTMALEAVVQRSMRHLLILFVLICQIKPSLSFFWNSVDEKDLILVVGLPRSGGEALHEFFQCNSVSSSHYCCDGSGKTSFPCSGTTCGECIFANMNTSRPSLSGCGNYRVFAQLDVETGQPFSWFLPQHYAMALLQNDYPLSTWILNRRSRSSTWADSILHWYSRATRLMTAFGLAYHPGVEPTVQMTKAYTNQQLYHELEQSIERAADGTEHERRRSELADAYERHAQNVRDSAAKHGQKLVEIDVDDPQTGTILAEAFGMRAECWKYDANVLDNDWQDFSLKV